MFLFRKIGKLICGSATPAQLMLACVLGAMMGFMPGVVQAMGIIALLTILLVLLNANLVLATIVGFVAAAVSWLALPASFYVGLALLDGPTQPIFEWAINAPVLALFGFEYYATTGGLVVGALFGVVVGFGVIKGVTAFRRKMAAVEQSSERYQAWTAKRWVRTLRWMLVGGAPKGGYQAALERHGKLIRPLGLAAAGGVVVLLVLTRFFLADDIVTAMLQRGLERANGATVDVRRATLSLSEGSLTVEGLQMADRNNPEKRNLFEADKLTADISTTDLLRKRLTLDNVTFNNAKTGSERTVPGYRTRPAPEPAEPPEPPEPDENEKTIEDYVKDARRWKARLAQIEEWVEWLAGDGAEREDEAPSWEERIRQRIARSGYAQARADHLVHGAPTLTVRYLEAMEMEAVQLDDEPLNLVAKNLSTHPHLLEEGPEVTITRANAPRQDEDRPFVGVHLAGVSKAGGTNKLAFNYTGLDVSKVMGDLKISGRAPLEGGTMDLHLNGDFTFSSGLNVNMPFEVKFRDTTMQIAGQSKHLKDPVTFALGLRGPLDNPAITFDDRHFVKQIERAGYAAFANRIKGEFGVDIPLDEIDGGDPIGAASDAVKQRADSEVRNRLKEFWGQDDEEE